MSVEEGRQGMVFKVFGYFPHQFEADAIESVCQEGGAVGLICPPTSSFFESSHFRNYGSRGIAQGGPTVGENRKNKGKVRSPDNVGRSSTRPQRFNKKHVTLGFFKYLQELRRPFGVILKNNTKKFEFSDFTNDGAIDGHRRWNVIGTANGDGLRFGGIDGEVFAFGPGRENVKIGLKAVSRSVIDMVENCEVVSIGKEFGIIGEDWKIVHKKSK